MTAMFPKDSDTKAVLAIEGMSCGHCVMRIEKGIAALPGVKSAKVDLDKKEGAFVFDARRVKIEEIKARIVDLGYEIK